MEKEILFYDTTPGVTAYTTRRGISSAECDKPFAGLSLCSYSGDDPDHVERSRKHLLRITGVTAGNPVTARQRHTAEVARVTTDNRYKIFDAVDALVTAEPGIALGIFTADCLPLLMYDPTAGIIAACHCGWRGTVNGIIGNTLSFMMKEGASPSEIRAITGPCICPECFEVGEEVAQQFPEECILRSFPKPHIDLRMAVGRQLLNEGLKPEYIMSPDECSRCNPTLYFSARRLGTKSGRTLSVIVRQ